MRVNDIRLFFPEYPYQLKQALQVTQRGYLPRHRHNNMPALFLFYYLGEFLSIGAYHQHIKPVLRHKAHLPGKQIAQCHGHGGNADQFFISCCFGQWFVLMNNGYSCTQK